MSINIHISGDHASDVIEHMRGLVAATGLPVPNVRTEISPPFSGPGEISAPSVEPEPVKRGRGRPKAVETAPPAPIQPEPDPEPAEEANLFDDAPAAEAPPAPEQFPATKEGMRKAMTKYAETYGMPAAQEDGPKMIGAKKMSELPDNSDWAKITTTIAAALESNPYGRQKAA